MVVYHVILYLWCKNGRHLYLWTRLRARYLVWSCIWWFIGTLPDRPRGYTVWSTLEPLRVDLRTWASVIQVGSAILTLRINSNITQCVDYLCSICSPAISAVSVRSDPTVRLGPIGPKKSREEPSSLGIKIWFSMFYMQRKRRWRDKGAAPRRLSDK
jgi:hypothetical protein